MAKSTVLTRPSRGRIVGGVCAAIAQRFDAPPLVVRLLFVASCILPGPQILLYVALWIIVPSE